MVARSFADRSLSAQIIARTSLGSEGKRRPLDWTVDNMEFGSTLAK
jgi:hypothetical protein